AIFRSFARHGTCSTARTGRLILVVLQRLSARLCAADVAVKPAFTGDAPPRRLAPCRRCGRCPSRGSITPKSAPPCASKNCFRRINRALLAKDLGHEIYGPQRVAIVGR